MVVMEVLKVKKKSVMTKRELMLYTIKCYIGSILGIAFIWLLFASVVKNSDSFLPSSFGYFLFGFMSLALLFFPVFENYMRWKRWDQFFPKTLYTNPKTREKKGLEHLENSMDMVAYIIALDETYENKLNIKTKEEQEYLLYILDSYYGHKRLEALNASFKIESK